MSSSRTRCITGRELRNEARPVGKVGLVAGQTQSLAEGDAEVRGNLQLLFLRAVHEPIVGVRGELDPSLVAPNQAPNAEEQTLDGAGSLPGRICRPSTNPHSGTQTDTWEPRPGVRSRIGDRSPIAISR